MHESDNNYALDPQVRLLLADMASNPLPAYASLPAEQARRIYRESRLQLQGPRAPMQAVAELAVPAPGGELALRLYKPFSLKGGTLPSPLPWLVFFHGGGLTLGDLDSHDDLCRGLAHQGQCAVASVAYRLAPEHRFPAAFDDAVAAVRWIFEAAGRLGLDPERMAIGGDSAGGALAAATAIALRDEPLKLSMQLLLYPITDMAHGLPSHRRLGQGYGLTREGLLWFRSNYLERESDVGDWRVSPLRASSHAGLPPACIITAGFDPLLDEGHAYAERLQAAGVPVMYECFGGMIHGFMLMTGVLAASRHAIYRAGQALRAAFGGVSLTVAPLRQHKAPGE
jgi:acetyl esterase